MLEYKSANFGLPSRKGGLMASVKELAYAKINLYLDILSKRDDGFHDIRTVMHTVSLADEVIVDVTPSARSSVKIVNFSSVKLPTDNRNLAYRAAELFLDRTMKQASVTITLKKYIPVAGGLAGGSSDAAATLRALNRAFKKPVTDKYLLSLAAELGSDVPYCLLGGTALCEGRGELITRIPTAVSLHFVIVALDEHVSTPVAYSALDEEYSNFKLPRNDYSGEAFEDLMQALKNQSMPDGELFNIFESVIFNTCNKAELAKSRLLELGATHALMSGSGPTVFGIFDSDSQAKNAASALTADGATAYYVHSI
jgi:4-diphosphocytidyl-2-C-methyl-D-erythritol kinase